MDTASRVVGLVGGVHGDDPVAEGGAAGLDSGRRDTKMNALKRTVSDRQIRWAYLWEEIKPRETNSCALFWRSVVVTPFKLVAPVVVAACALWFFTVVPIVRFYAPATSWLPVTRAGPTQADWAIFGGVVGGIAACAACAFIGWIGSLLGFWSWLHHFCLPVEIEGGLVNKGSCPKCSGHLVLSATNNWDCRKCHGVFIPPPETPEGGLQR